MMWRFDRFGDAVALLDEHGQSLTYAQLAREGEALCGAIGGRCLCFGLCGNTIGSAVGYAGILFIQEINQPFGAKKEETLKNQGFFCIWSE